RRLPHHDGRAGALRQPPDAEGRLTVGRKIGRRRRDGLPEATTSAGGTEPHVGPAPPRSRVRRAAEAVDLVLPRPVLVAQLASEAARLLDQLPVLAQAREA